MSSSGTRGYGTTLSIAGTAIGQIRDISGPEADVDAIDLSNTESPSRTREFIAGFIDEGEVSFDLVYKKATGTTLRSHLGAATNEAIVITFPDTSHVDFNGFVSGLGFEAPFEDKVTCPVKIKVGGVVTFTAGS